MLGVLPERAPYKLCPTVEALHWSCQHLLVPPVGALRWSLLLVPYVRPARALALSVGPARVLALRVGPARVLATTLGSSSTPTAGQPETVLIYCFSDRKLKSYL